MLSSAMELRNRKPSARELLPCHPFPSDPWVVMTNLEPKAERRDHYPRMGTHLFVRETDLESVRNVQLGGDAPFHMEGFTELLAQSSNVDVDTTSAAFVRYIDQHTLPEMIEERWLRACRPIAGCTHNCCAA